MHNDKDIQIASQQKNQKSENTMGQVSEFSRTTLMRGNKLLAENCAGQYINTVDNATVRINPGHVWLKQTYV